ncbi:MAG TPA: glycosyltransferase, partial [Vicinamibacterales bacterium]|nr:glycosyltransferase [Vicinamibacterales bacterium]
MRVLLTSEARFERTPDGTIWAPAAYGRALWSRYLDVFSAVLVAARVSTVQEASSGSVEASTSGVRFCPLPPYAGLSGLVQHLAAVRGSIAGALRTSPAVIVRAPSPLAYLTGRAAAGAGRPFAAEIVGDPDQVFSPGAFRHPLRLPIRCLAAAAQRRLSRNAIAVLYVTRDALQRRYPTRGSVHAASDVALDDLSFAARPCREWSPPASFVLVTVGALDQPYKGTGVLLDAVSQLRGRGLPVRLRIVGDGRLLPDLERRCEELGASGDVEFLGRQDREGVRSALDSAHLFVLPSLTEGLPRALVEAMARGLPAVATDVGGIPELLPTECLVPPRQPRALADRIEQLMKDEAGRRRLGASNRSRALEYHERTQADVRRTFLRVVRDASRTVPQFAVRCSQFAARGPGAEQIIVEHDAETGRRLKYYSRAADAGYWTGKW